MGSVENEPESSVIAMIVSLQLLRFVAASLIVLNHSIQEFAGPPTFGAFGVDIFFVISGFIVSHITQDGREQFFARRLIRIVPLYWALTCAIAVIGYGAPQLLRHVNWDVAHTMASLLFIPWWTESLEFQPMLPMGWTLNYELWFYLLFYMAMRINISYREGICTFLILCVYVTTNLLVLDRTAPLSFYSNSLVFEFMFGMAISVLYRKRKAMFDHAPRGMVFLGAAAAATVFNYATLINSLGLPRCVYWGVPACLSVMVCLCAEAQFRRVPRWMMSAVLAGGEISYPLYLMHMFVIAVLSRVILLSTLSVFEGFLLALLLSSIAAYLASRYFDKPIRKMLSVALLKRSVPV